MAYEKKCSDLIDNNWITDIRIYNNIWIVMIIYFVCEMCLRLLDKISPMEQWVMVEIARDLVGEYRHILSSMPKLIFFTI